MIRFFVLLLMSLLLFSFHETYIYNIVNKTINYISYPIPLAIKSINHSVNNVFNFFITQDVLIKKLNTLKSENILINLENKKLRIFLKEEKIIKKLKKIKNLDKNFVIAKIFNMSVNKYTYFGAYINKGKKDNLKIGSIIFDNKGIIGQIITVMENMAFILPITDSIHNIPIVNKRTNVRFLAKGLGIGDTLSVITKTYGLDVKIGDKILTSGFGEKFFPNYPVGEVVGIYKNRQELTTEFRIKTATVINNKTMVGVYSKITDKKLINK